MNEKTIVQVRVYIPTQKLVDYLLDANSNENSEEYWELFGNRNDTPLSDVYLYLKDINTSIYHDDITEHDNISVENIIPFEYVPDWFMEEEINNTDVDFVFGNTPLEWEKHINEKKEIREKHINEKKEIRKKPQKVCGFESTVERIEDVSLSSYLFYVVWEYWSTPGFSLFEDPDSGWDYIGIIDMNNIKYVEINRSKENK